ncbi:protein of unknown function [Actinomadura meyerae]|jgi:hypothetical protein|uniref:DUF397 domain-containing protein n=1 Tax=Actinomadura meyerae TaxID=240840 RepID=A0A239F729_9ACTN|nr:DUF397 domain-containing protein [Actinomadura meyerae]SNS52696.1 protein of unknown function [Actinomadura meyerae]
MEELNTTWRKSTHSGNDGGHCVELADLGEVVGLRDSKDPDGPKLIMQHADFSALLTSLKR